MSLPKLKAQIARDCDCEKYEDCNGEMTCCEVMMKDEKYCETIVCEVHSKDHQLMHDEIKSRGC